MRTTTASFFLTACCFLMGAPGCGSSPLQTAGDPGSGGGSGSGGALAGSGGGGASAGSSSGDGGSAAVAGSGGAPAPVTPDVLIGLSDFATSNVSGPANSERITVTGMPFENAWRASMAEPPEGTWTAQLIIPLLEQTVAEGDLLHVSFWVRCEVPGVSGDCATQFIFERASDPWEKSVIFGVNAHAAWSQYSEYFRVVANYGPREAHMLFRLGYAEQVIEIGGVIVERIPAP